MLRSALVDGSPTASTMVVSTLTNCSMSCNALFMASLPLPPESACKRYCPSSSACCSCSAASFTTIILPGTPTSSPDALLPRRTWLVGAVAADEAWRNEGGGSAASAIFASDPNSSTLLELCASEPSCPSKTEPSRGITACSCLRSADATFASATMSPSSCFSCRSLSMQTLSVAAATTWTSAKRADKSARLPSRRACSRLR
mmetsp:Transcript_29032/g.67539  ORF Transcript_29032/g.67539 Transcript_29032/m.67539 type:complete len:202 (+) Transcript_29032:858-1463(+)